MEKLVISSINIRREFHTSSKEKHLLPHHIIRKRNKESKLNKINKS